jgi:hypothetical protein
MRFYDLLHITSQYFSSFSWRDYTEIFSFSLLVYYISCWLAKDNKNNLLPIFYGYVATVFLSFLICLPTITNALLAFAPALLMFLFMVHTTTLQKNFIAFTRTPSKDVVVVADWVEILIRNCLYALADNKKIICLIEHTHDLSSYVHCPLVIQAPIHEAVFHCFVKSPLFHTNQMVWVSTSGFYKGINTTLQNAHSSDWHTQGILLTTHTDALILTVHDNHSFNVMAEGKLITNIPATQIIPLLKKYSFSAHTTHTKGAFHDYSHKKTSGRQPLP